MLHQDSNVDWPSAVLLADALDEPFSEITVITARKFFFTTACDMARQQLNDPAESEVHTLAAALIANRSVTIKEHVTIDDDGITVCLNVRDPEDESVPWKSIRYLQQALDQLDGQHGTVTFGEPLAFALVDVGSVKLTAS